MKILRIGFIRDGGSIVVETDQGNHWIHGGLIDDPDRSKVFPLKSIRPFERATHPHGPVFTHEIIIALARLADKSLTGHG